MDFHSIEVRVAKNVFDGCIDVLIKKVPAQGEASLCTNMTFEKIDRDGFPIRPSFHMGDTQAQALMDQLWACGVRPTDSVPSAGWLQAQSTHLEDMRRLVFSILDVNSARSLEEVLDNFHKSGDLP